MRTALAGLLLAVILVIAIVVRSRSASPVHPAAAAPSRPALTAAPPVERVVEQPVVAEAPKKQPEPAPREPARLKEWLLALPDRDFAPLVGTRTLDDYVAHVMDELSAPRPNADGPPVEAGRFLDQLNQRIRSAKE